VVEVLAYSKSNGAVIDIWSDNNGSNRLWKVIKDEKLEDIDGE